MSTLLALVPVPVPVIVPVHSGDHSDGSGPGVPAWLILGYLVGAVVAWPVLARLGVGWLLGPEAEPVERFFTVILAACAAMFWPLLLAALPVWWLVSRAPDKGGEQR